MINIDTKILCINAKDKPNDIPITKWVVEGETYTITKFMRMRMDGNIIGVKLKELNLDEYFPYTYIRLDRFSISEDQIENLVGSIGIEEINALYNKLIE